VEGKKNFLISEDGGWEGAPRGHVQMLIKFRGREEKIQAGNRGGGDGGTPAHITSDVS